MRHGVKDWRAESHRRPLTRFLPAQRPNFYIQLSYQSSLVKITTLHHEAKLG